MVIYASKNPAGIFINDGYYALLAAIYGLSVEESLHKICLLPLGGNEKKRQMMKRGEKVAINIEKLRSTMNCKCISYRDLADLVGYSYGKIAQTVKGVKQPKAFVNELERVLDLEKDSLIKGM